MIKQYDVIQTTQKTLAKMYMFIHFKFNFNIICIQWVTMRIYMLFIKIKSKPRTYWMFSHLAGLCWSILQTKWSYKVCVYRSIWTDCVLFATSVHELERDEMCLSPFRNREKDEKKTIYKF